MSELGSPPGNTAVEFVPNPSTFGRNLALTAPGSEVEIMSTETFDGPDGAMRCAVLAKQRGLEPIPHMTARSIRSEEHAIALCTQAAEAGITKIFVMGGDAEYNPDKQKFPDGLSLIRFMSELPEDIRPKGIRVPGYPAGHHDKKIADKHIADLQAKQELSDRFEDGIEIGTQFVMGHGVVISYIARLRQHGVDMPVHVGLIGAASNKQARHVMKLVSGDDKFKAFKLGLKMGMWPQDLVPSIRARRSMRLFERLMAADADIAGVIINPLGAWEKTKELYGPVFALARELKIRREYCPEKFTLRQSNRSKPEGAAVA